ncbi:PepSY-associated TM helix domain-containing protein [Sphingomonas koreensis]
MSRARILIRRVHLWLGLSVGLLFVLLGLTGSALVFYIEIDAALNRSAIGAVGGSAPGWSSPAWDRALATARQRWPDPGGDWSFESTGEGGAIPARYYPPSQGHGHHAEREMVWFSADGSSVLRAEPWGGYLMSWIYELHMHLLAGETGRQIVGWSGVATLVLLVTGIVTWWPRGSWRKALAFKRRTVPTRRLRDLHKHFGLWSSALLLVLVATGVLLSLPAVKTQVIAVAIATPDTPAAPHSTASEGRQIPVSTALAAAHRALPDARLAFIDVPGAGNKPFRMRVQVPGDPHRRFPSSFIFVDQYSGRVLAIHDIRKGNAGTGANAWIRTLHDGSVGGIAARILAVLLGLIPAILFGTGLLHWMRRRARRPLQIQTVAQTGNNL